MIDLVKPKPLIKNILKYILILILGLVLVRFITNLQKSKIKVNELSSSTLWPNIDDNLFQDNLTRNLNETLYLYQGSGTNLCAFSAITYHLIKSDPAEYKRLVTELYQKGETITKDGKTLKPSDAVRKYAGTLKNTGRLDINHADQLWFLTLADNYKGYVNIINWSYNYGDESNTWASTNFGKFNRILKSLTGKEIVSKGSDLLRPSIDNYYQYIKDLQQNHSILLYLNNTVLNKRDFSSITWPIPTHFVELYNLYPKDDYYVLEYWDYGFLTKEIIKRDKFNELIFGITSIKK